MKLRFLGQVYASANNSIATVTSEQTANFRGQRYTLRHPVRTFIPQVKAAKKYRGVSY